MSGFMSLLAPYPMKQRILIVSRAKYSMLVMPFPGLKIRSHTQLEGEKGFYLGIYFKDP